MRERGLYSWLCRIMAAYTSAVSNLRLRVAELVRVPYRPDSVANIRSLTTSATQNLSIDKALAQFSGIAD